MKKIKYKTIEIVADKKEIVKKELIRLIENGDKITIMSVNGEIIARSEQDKGVKESLEEGTINLPDGFSTILLAKKIGLKIEERIPGIEICEFLLEKASENKEKIVLFGAEEWVIQKVNSYIKRKYEGIEIVGSYNGFDYKWEYIKAQINKNKPKYLFIALGSPYQENFIKQYKDELDVQVIQPVGGTFDVMAGKVKRAPKWIRAIKLEWLYRTSLDKKRVKRTTKLLYYVALTMIKRGNNR